MLSLVLEFVRESPVLVVVVLFVVAVICCCCVVVFVLSFLGGRCGRETPGCWNRSWTRNPGFWGGGLFRKINL